MKIRFAIFSLLVLLLLVVSQIVWVNQVAKRDKGRFKEELTIVVNDIVKHQATKQVYELYEIDSELPSITLEALNPDSIPVNSKSYGSYEFTNYKEKASISKFIEAAMTEMLFEKNTINLQALDTLFHNNFPYTEELSGYFFKMQKGDETIDSLLVGKNTTQLLNDTTTGVFVTIPLGTSGTYRFVSHFEFRPSTMTRSMMAPVWLSGVAVIAVAIILFMLLFRLQRQMVRLQLQEKRTRGIVHDLKSPLSYLYTLLGLFEMDEKDLQKSEQLTKGKSRIKSLSENIERMLSEVKLNENKSGNLLREPYDLEQHCKEIVDDLQTINKEKEIEVSYAIEPDAKTIYVDAFYFDSCLRNLFDNAIKYSGNSPIITITAKKEKKKICITFTDNGVGIPKEEQRKVFKQFFRSNEQSAVKGHGVGLSFVKQVVKMHGGTITLNSLPGKGSTFIVNIPNYTPNYIPNKK